MHHLDLFSLLVQMHVALKLLGMYDLVEVRAEGLVLRDGNRTVLAILLPTVDALDRVVAILVRVVEWIVQVHNERQVRRVLVKDAHVEGGVLLGRIVQIVDERPVVLREVDFRVMVIRVIIGLRKTVLRHYVLVDIKKVHIFVEPEEPRDPIFVLKLVLIVRT